MTPETVIDTNQAGILRINPRLRRISIGLHELPLTKGQYDLFCTLIQREGEIVPFKDLHRVACSFAPWTGDTRPLRQQIHKLSQAMGVAGGMIRNFRGVGYAIVLDRPVH